MQKIGTAKTVLLFISLAAGSAVLEGGAAGLNLPATRGWLAFTPAPVNGADREERGQGTRQEPLRGETERTRHVISVKDALVR